MFEASEFQELSKNGVAVLEKLMNQDPFLNAETEEAEMYTEKESFSYKNESFSKQGSKYLAMREQVT